MFDWLKFRHYWSILFAQIFLLFVAVFMTHHIVLTVLFTLALLGVFGSVIQQIWTSSLARILALISGGIAGGSLFLHLVPHVTFNEVEISLIICCLAYALFILIAIVAIAKHVFISDRVTIDRLVGSICLYLLIGMFFAFIYGAIYIGAPETFYIKWRNPNEELLGLRDFLYFSYITISTIGYGDMLPTHPASRMLACIEGMVGPIYLAIVVARLVGMHITQGREKRT
jgi:hypothetical protein